MRNEPAQKRTVAFFDGQNLFHAAKSAFGYSFPNYDPLKLARLICDEKGWLFVQARLYTGIHDRLVNPNWHDFWASKITKMNRDGVYCYTRKLRYRNSNGDRTFNNTSQNHYSVEKGIDVRIALDVVRMSRLNELDVALIFSQDQDLSEAATEVRNVSLELDRWIKIACAFPISPESPNQRGINHTDWIIIKKSDYDQCVDPYDYRP
jgi:uncharacterized LabA/DUF88 family protein